METTRTKAYVAKSATDHLATFAAPRREADASDVTLEALYCGVCHSDMEMIEIDDINEAYEHMTKADVKYRSVTDMVSLKS